METNQPTQSNTTNSVEDKTAAVLSYITIIGFFVAMVLHSNKKTNIGSYHLKQSLGLIVTSIVLWMGVSVLAFIPFLRVFIALMPIVWIGVLVFIVMGIINAANGESKPLPYVGKLYEQWFADMFN